MPRPLVTYPDVEEQTVDHLTDDLNGEDCTVGIGLPDGWTVDSPPHIRVALDGTPRDLHPAVQQPTVRITVWAKHTPTAKHLAQLAHGHLLARPEYRALTGLLPAHDPTHDAELASFTVRATVHSTPI